MYNSCCCPVAAQYLAVKVALPQEHEPGLPPPPPAHTKGVPSAELGNVAEHSHPAAPVLCAQPHAASRRDSAGAWHVASMPVTADDACPHAAQQAPCCSAEAPSDAQRHQTRWRGVREGAASAAPNWRHVTSALLHAPAHTESSSELTRIENENSAREFLFRMLMLLLWSTSATESRRHSPDSA